MLRTILTAAARRPARAWAAPFSTSEGGPPKGGDGDGETAPAAAVPAAAVPAAAAAAGPAGGRGRGRGRGGRGAAAFGARGRGARGRGGRGVQYRTGRGRGGGGDDGEPWLATEVLQGFEREVILGGVRVNPEAPPPPREVLEDEVGGGAGAAAAPAGTLGPGDLGANWNDGSPAPAPETERDMTYLLRRRRQGAVIAPGEYDHVSHRHDRSAPHELYARLDGHRGDWARCDKKTGFHLVDAKDVFAGNMPVLAEFVSDSGMIHKRQQSRLCAKCQRNLRRTVKRARALGLVPFDDGFEAKNTLGFPDDDHKARVSKTI